MTLKAARALRLADVVLVDELVNRGCLAHARSDARIIEVGKRGGCKSTPQAFIEKMLVEYGERRTHRRPAEGRRSLRLRPRRRGGSRRCGPQGIEVEVIPGITAGTAVPATLGIPVTHRRGGARRDVRDRAHQGRPEPDWQALARSGMTLVIYMGLDAPRSDRFGSGRGGVGPRRRRPASSRTARCKTQRQVVGTLGTLHRRSWRTGCRARRSSSSARSCASQPAVRFRLTTPLSGGRRSGGVTRVVVIGNGMVGQRFLEQLVGARRRASRSPCSARSRARPTTACSSRASFPARAPPI